MLLVVVYNEFINEALNLHCVKSVRIQSYSGPYFPAFGLNKGRNGVSLPIQFECGEIQTRITPNTNIFHAVRILKNFLCKTKGILIHSFPTHPFYTP